MFTQIKIIDFLLIPNLVTLIRFFILIIFVILMAKSLYFLSFISLFLSAFLDIVDGYLSRKLNQVSELGKILDPFVDKLTFIITFIILYVYLPVLNIFIAVAFFVFLKEMIFIIFGFYALWKNYTIIPAHIYAKIGTLVLFIFIFLSFLEGAFLKIYTKELKILLTINAFLYLLISIVSIYFYYKIWKQKLSNNK